MLHSWENEAQVYLIYPPPVVGIFSSRNGIEYQDFHLYFNGRALSLMFSLTSAHCISLKYLFGPVPRVSNQVEVVRNTGAGVPLVAQMKQIQLVSMRMWV